MRKVCAFMITILLLMGLVACEEKATTHTLFFNTNGGLEIASVKLYDYEVAQLPDPIKEGNDFLGWYTDNTFQTKVIQPFYINKDTVIYACWKTAEPLPPTPTHADVTFKLYGEEDIVESIAISSKLTAFPEKNKDGYRLIWYNDSSYSKIYDIQTEITEPTTLYGKWLPLFNIANGQIISLTDYAKTLSEIIVPEIVADWQITSLASTAFRKCENLKTITLNKSITTIGSRVFNGSNNLENIIVDKENTSFIDADGVLYSKDLEKLLAFPKAKKSAQYLVNTNTNFIANDAFGNCTGVQEIVLPPALQTIDIQAFSECTADIVINQGITIITQNAFSGYKGLSITLPNIVEIEEYAFKNCANLKSILLPQSLYNLGEKAFYQCQNLEKIILPENVEVLYADAFLGCDNLEEIIIKALSPPTLKGNTTIHKNTIIYVKNKHLYEENQEWSLLIGQIESIE